MKDMKDIYDKLDYFDRIILKEAAHRRDSVLRQIREERDVIICKEKLVLQNKADEMLKAELQKIDNESHDIISKAFIESRQLLGKTRANIIKEVITELHRRVEEFVAGPDYPEYLEHCIVNACSQAGEGELVVHISSTDMVKHRLLLEQIKSHLGIVYENAGDSIIGGCRVLNRNANYLLDNSISSRIRQSEENFLQTSSLRID